MVGCADRNAAEMPKTRALLSIFCGVITAGIIMLIASHGVLGVVKMI